MSINSNLSAEEEFRLTGAVTGDRLTELLDTYANVGSLADLDGPLVDARAQYPAEDFLSDPIGKLHAIAKRLRGDNRSDLLAVIEQLDDIAQTTHYATEFGMKEIGKVIDCIKASNL